MIIYFWFFIVIYHVFVNLVSEGNKDEKSLLIRQAQKRNGSLKTSRLHNPKIQFIHNDYQVSVNSPLLKPFERYVVIESNAIPNIRVKIQQKKLIEKTLQRFGKRYIEIDSPKFNRTHVINGGNTTFAKSLITPDLRERLIDASIKGCNVSVEIMPKRLIYRLVGKPTNNSEYDKFIGTALVFADNLKSIEPQADNV